MRHSRACSPRSTCACSRRVRSVRRSNVRCRARPPRTVPCLRERCTECRTAPVVTCCLCRPEPNHALVRCSARPGPPPSRRGVAPLRGYGWSGQSRHRGRPRTIQREPSSRRTTRRPHQREDAATCRPRRTRYAGEVAVGGGWCLNHSRDAARPRRLRCPTIVGPESRPHGDARWISALSSAPITIARPVM